MIWSTVGLTLLFKATSFTERWIDVSQLLWDGTVNSPHRRNPKKAMQHAAHSMIWSCFFGSLKSSAFIFSKMSCVMGSLLLDGLFFACSFLMPRSTISTLGVSWEVNWSCALKLICRFLTAER